MPLHFHRLLWSWHPRHAELCWITNTPKAILCPTPLLIPSSTNVLSASILRSMKRKTEIRALSRSSIKPATQNQTSVPPRLCPSPLSLCIRSGDPPPSSEMAHAFPLSHPSNDTKILQKFKDTSYKNILEPLYCPAERRSGWVPGCSRTPQILVHWIPTTALWNRHSLHMWKFRHRELTCPRLHSLMKPGWGPRTLESEPMLWYVPRNSAYPYVSLRVRI